MEIDDLTEKQAKNLINFIGKKANGDLWIRSLSLIFKPVGEWTYFYVGIDSDEYCYKHGIEPRSRCLDLKCNGKEPHKQMLKAMFELTCKFHCPLALPGANTHVEVMPKDKTLEEWLVQMDLES